MRLLSALIFATYVEQEGEARLKWSPDAVAESEREEREQE